jgi:hypothetical protein
MLIESNTPFFFEIEGYFHLVQPARIVRFSPSPWSLDFPGATVTRLASASGLPKYALKLDVAQPEKESRIEGNLEFEATHAEWSVPGGLLFEEVGNPSHQHHWVVHVPQARVSGHLKLTDQGRTIPISVDQWVGYHDHNWGTRPIGQGFGRWTWGRALLPDGQTVISASIAASSTSGAGGQRISHASVVLAKTGVVSEILGRIEPVDPTPSGTTIEVPNKLEFGLSKPNQGHRVRFDNVSVVKGEIPGRYQRRVAKVTLTGPNGAQSGGMGVTETLIASAFPS